MRDAPSSVRIVLAILVFLCPYRVWAQADGKLHVQEGGTAYQIGKPLSVRTLEATLEEAMARNQDSASTAAILAILASRHSAQHRFSEAEPLYKRSLATFENALG